MAHLRNALQKVRFPSLRQGALWMGIAALVVGSATPPPPPPRPAPPPPPPAPVPVPPPVVEAPKPPPFTGKVSNAKTQDEYRRDAAKHVYEKNADRIFKGVMPPLLPAVCTISLEIDGQGNVTKVDWMRPPSQPEIRAEIERSLRAAAPYPAPTRLGRVIYTDTWLWHKSGRFQLHTLTEGQL